MTIEVVSFIIGGILIATAVVGGGFEVKEIKVPRVGAGVRIASLIVGSGFLLLAMGIWGASNPQLLAENPPTNALVADAKSSSAAPQQNPAAQPAPPVQAREVVQQAPVHPDPKYVAEPGFTGFTGDTYLSWNMQGVGVSAAARFAGTGGMIRIGWVDPATGMQDEVLQDLVLQQDNNGVIFYQGANPRHPSTGQPRQDYAPDQFRVVQSQQGWTIDEICDVQACWPVFVQ